jgi:hypothetical protein
MNTWTRGLILGIALAGSVWTVAARGEDKPAAEPPAVESQLDGQLRIAQPVSVHEPASTMPHACSVNDVYLFPVQYPISPPFPKSATASSDGPAVAAKDVVRASGQLAYLTIKPQTGGRLGVGYLLVFVKALAPGKATVTAKITLADGKVKEVPFAIVVEANVK